MHQLKPVLNRQCVAETKRAYAYSRAAARADRRSVQALHIGRPEDKDGLRPKFEASTDCCRTVPCARKFLFLAGGLAFNILLALVPFALLLISGISFVLGREPEDAASTIIGLIDSLLPRDAPAPGKLLRELVAEIMKTRGTVGIYSAISFAWFSTRLFGSLRSVLALIFDGSDRGISTASCSISCTMWRTIAVAIYVVISAYLTLATTRAPNCW